MSARDTAIRVIEWAIAGSGPPPRGDLFRTEELGLPDGRLAEALGQLTSITAARLRLGSPPLGDPGPVGPGAALMAAALGVAHVPELVQYLLQAVPEAAGDADWVARHGIADRALGYLAGPLADEFRLVSPLTALLDRPVREQQAQAIAHVLRLIGRREARLALQLALAQPTASPEVRRWRGILLGNLRLQGDDGRRFVLEVYEAALIHHQAEVLEQVQAAWAVLQNPAASADESRLAEALSIAKWWEPLSALDRSESAALRGRRYLDPSYRKGIKLYRQTESLTRGSGA
jgi:hypothetical protein